MNFARLCLVVIAVAAAACARPEPVSKAQPDIVLITLDTTRADHLSAYGYARETSPNLDALASDALRFERAYAVSSWTLPSHASLFTGKFPSAHGAQYDPRGPLNLVQEGGIEGPKAWRRIRARPLSQHEITLASVLRANGYATGGVVAGPWMKQVFGLGVGYDHYDDANFMSHEGVGELNGRRAADVTDAAIAFVETHRAEPFHLFVNYYDPHAPLIPPERDRHRFWDGDAPIAPTPDYQLALYDAEIWAMDRELGRLLDRLRQLGLYENAWIIVVADHGELMGEGGLFGHGSSLTEPEIRIPLIVKEPGPDRPRGVRHEPVQQVDVMPTLLARLGMPLPPNVQGRPLPQPDHPIVAEVYPLPAANPAAQAWQQRGDWRVLVEGTTKLAWSSRGRHALYDLAADPDETQNLWDASDPEMSALAERLAAYFEGLPAPGELGEIGELDDETRRMLESLGYVGESD